MKQAFSLKEEDRPTKRNNGVNFDKKGRPIETMTWTLIKWADQERQLSEH